MAAGIWCAACSLYTSPQLMHTTHILQELREMSIRSIEQPHLELIYEGGVRALETELMHQRQKAAADIIAAHCMPNPLLQTDHQASMHA